MKCYTSHIGVHGVHRAISYVWTLGDASGRTFFFADGCHRFRDTVVPTSLIPNNFTPGATVAFSQEA